MFSKNTSKVPINTLTFLQKTKHKKLIYIYISSLVDDDDNSKKCISSTKSAY